MIENTITYYESVNVDFTNLIVLEKNNVYDQNFKETTLFEALNYCSNANRKKLFNELAYLLYDIDPSYGYGEFEDILIKIKNSKNYKERRKTVKQVKYFSSNFIVSGIGYVVLDIDFKSMKIISYNRLKGLKSNIINYFEEHNSSVFLVESLSGLGYHIAMSFHSDKIDKNSYQCAYDFYANEIQEKTGIENLKTYIDYTVANLNSFFFMGNSAIGENGSMLFKNPTMSLKIIIEETEILNLTEKLTIDQFYSDFLLTHYSKSIPQDCLAFNEYHKWNKMILAIVATFQKNKDRAYYWFEKFSQLAEPHKIDKDQNDYEFDRIYDWKPDPDIGINYILSQIFGYGKFSNYIPYSFDDVMDYFEKNYQFLENNENSITNNYDEKLLINSYIDEIKDVLVQDENIMLIAPPNSGKSFYFINQKHTIFLTPTSILRDDLAGNNPNTFKIMAGEDVVPNKSTYIGNYDAIFKLVNSSMNLKEYTLVVDESHELFVSANLDFRYKVVNKIVNSFFKFKNIVLLTGTPIQFKMSEFKFKTIYIVKKMNRTPKLEIVSTDTPLSTMTDEIINTVGKQLCFINNKKQIEKVFDIIKLKQPDRNVIILTSNTKNDEEIQMVLQNNILPEDTIVLGTQMILEGISFKDNDMTHLRLYQPILAEYIAQFNFRSRNSANPPSMVMYTKPKDYKTQRDALPINAYNTLEKKIKNILKELKNGIESTNYVLENEENFRRVCEVNLKNKNVPLPIILYHDGEYEIDELFLGQIALDITNKKLSIDLFSLLSQLIKWNFQFKFRKAETSNNLKLHNEATVEYQINIIQKHFQDFINYENINPKHKILYPIWLFSKILDFNYLLNMSETERFNMFINDKIFKISILKIGVWARETKLFNPKLEFLVSKFKLESLINMIVLVKQNILGEEISHKKLMQLLNIPENQIKDVKSKLRLYFNITNINKNGVRSVMFEINDLSIIDSILLDQFSIKEDSPF